MEESVLTISNEIHKRLRPLIKRKDVARVPRNLLERRPNVVLVGKANKEQQAIAILYSEAMIAHNKMHTRMGIPFGVHPDVGPAHYRNHVMMGLLYEMFMWSVHRSFRRRTEGLMVRFDSKWNMYAPAPLRSRKKKT